jgi:hypothetical protein
VYIGNSGPASQAVFTNTILVSHTLGVQLANASNVTFTAALWGNDTEYDVTGSGQVDFSDYTSGDPAFVAPGAGNYHIGATSAALDAGVDSGVSVDMDGDARPQGAGYDLGADEYVEGGGGLAIKAWHLTPAPAVTDLAPQGGELADDEANVAQLDAARTRHNTPPQANDDTAATRPGEAVALAVLDNDSDLESAVHVSAISQPRHGTVRLQGGVLIYTPEAGFVGEDTWTYTLTDGALSSTALVTVQVDAAASIAAPFRLFLPVTVK